MDLYNVCERKLKYLNYSDSTTKTYLNYIDKFLSKVGKHSSRVNSKDFQSYLDSYEFPPVSQQNQVRLPV